MAENIEDLILPEIPKELAQQFNLLEQKFVRAEVDQIRSGVTRFRPLLKERDEAIAKSALKDHFWIQVFANSPPDVDEYVLEDDAAVLGTALKNLSVERFEVDDKGQGEPRSFRLTFEFRPEDNENFDNEKLVKDFYWRKQITRSPSGKKRTWEGLVSEPVRINWKPGKDLTKGLLDAACDLADAEKKGKGDRKDLPEFAKLQTKLEEAAEANQEGKDADDDDFDLGGMSPAGTSFFSLFGYRGRKVSADESKAATKEDDERFEKLLKGEQVDEENDEDVDEDDDEEDIDEAAEIFPDGDELAIALAEDLYTHAFKYFGSHPDDDISDLEDGSDEEDEEGEEERPRKKAKV